MSNHPYRTQAVARPVLSWWERVAVLLLDRHALTHFQWYRRHTGGAWIRYDGHGWFRETHRALDELLIYRGPFAPDDSERWPEWDGDRRG